MVQLTTSKLTDLLHEYLVSNYHDEILALLPRSVFVFQLTDQKIQDIFVENMDDFKDALQRAVLSIKEEQVGKRHIVEFENLRVKLTDSKLITIAEAFKDSKSINSPIYFDAMVIGLERIEAYVEKYYAICYKCNKNYEFIAKLDDAKCINCEGEKLNFIEELNKYNYTQDILIQEPDTNNPQILRGRLRDELVNTCHIGSKQRILGILRAYSDKDGNAKLRIEVISLEPLELSKEVELVEEDIERFRIMASNNEDEYLKKLYESYAPHIQGRELEKQACLLSITGASNLGEFRHQSHLLLVGDPSTGKSELIKFAVKVHQKANYVDGPNASSKGLVFGLDEYENRKILRAGALVTYSGGLVGIDEFDKMSPTDRKAVNVVLEQQFAKYDKVGFNVTGEAKTAVIAASNPNNQRWREGKSIMDNLEPLEDSIVSKFDVIIRLKNIPHQDSDRKQIEHILNNLGGETEEVLDIQLFKGLLNYVRKQNPQLTDDAKKLIANFYVKFRSIEQDEEKGDLPIEPRQAVGLIRLSTAYAKLTFKKSVDVDTVNKVLGFYKQTLETLGMRTDDGIHQVNLLGEKANRDEHFKTLTKEIRDENGTWTEEQIITIMMEKGKTHWPTIEHAHTYWQKILKSKPTVIYEPKPGRYSWV